MKQNEIQDLPKLNSENLENIFNVYQDKNGAYFYNLLQTIEFPKNLPPNLFTVYTTKYGDTWPFISYKVYNTPNLWWLILIANNIQNATFIPKPGTAIAIPITDVAREVISQLK